MMPECKVCRNVEIIDKLAKKFEHLRHVKSSECILMNIYNAGRRKYLGRIRNIIPEVRVLLAEEYKHKLYIIELNKDAIKGRVDADKKKYRLLRALVVFHELHHIDPRGGGRIKGHTVHDFLQVLNTVGISLWSKKVELPNILKGKL